MQPPPDPDPVPQLIERYLEAWLAGEPLQLEQLGRDLDPSQRQRLRAGALAEEYLMRRAGGESLELAAWLKRLDSEHERLLFQEVLDDQRAARQVLPGELLPGHVLDERYEIKREIGAGGMGRIYAAEDRELGREVALKVLRVPLDSLQGAEWQEMFREESRTLAGLESRNIVAIHDVCRGREHSYFVMDLVPGLDLESVIQRVRAERARLPEHDARGAQPLRLAIGREHAPEREDLLRERSHERCVARILRTAAQAVERAHEAGVVHRDLKPRNFLLVPGGEPVLLDFGLASRDAGDGSDSFKGTPEYLAPEQVAQQRSGHDPRTDVYQLGLVLYELLTLERAFCAPADGDLGQLLERIREGRIRPARELVPHLSPTLEAILARALARDPSERYGGARELREDLECFLVRMPPKHARLSPARAVGLVSLRVLRHPLSWVAALLLIAGQQTLRAPPWEPPLQVSAFRAEAGTVTALDPLQPLQVTGTSILGLDVSTDRVTWLYVFSVFGRGADQGARYLRPLAPDFLADVLAPGYRPERPFGPVRLEAGTHRIACTALRNPAPYEGLRIYASREEDLFLARFQESLHQRERTLRAPVRWDEARALSEELTAQVRGDPLGALTEPERSAIWGEALAADTALGEADWLQRDLIRFDFLFEVSSADH